MIAAFLLATALPFTVTTDLPGGNAVVESIDETNGEVRLRPDCRGMADAWFWWACRVQGAGGRRLTFRFPRPIHPNKMCVGSLGPAVSTDGGRSWRWLNPEGRADPDSFTLDFAPDDGDVHLAFAPPYTAADWPFRTETLTRSREGRGVPVTRFGDGRRWRIFLTARHHACESTASRVLEGAVAALMRDPWIAENAHVEAIPFMDMDGVEKGEQGKGRLPHDHNRDYVQFIYPETRALRGLVERAEPTERLVLIDFHDPLAGTVEGGPNPRHDRIFSFGPREPQMAERWNRYRRLLTEETAKGSLRYSPDDDVPYGTGANVEANYRSGGSTESAARWFRAQRGAWLSFAQETGFARAGGVVTPRSARELGAAVARTVVRLLKDERPTVVLGGTLAAVRSAVAARRRGEEVLLFAPRPYLGEERAGTYDLERHPDDDPADPLIAEMFNPAYGAKDAYQVRRGKGWRAVELLAPFSNRTVMATGALAERTTPFLVKRTLDRALLAEGVTYLTGAVATEVRPDGVTLVTCEGERRIDAERVIDARLAGPQSPGEYDLCWRVVRNAAKPRVETVVRRVRLGEVSPSALARAEREARDAAFAPDLVDMAPMGRWAPVGPVEALSAPRSCFRTSADVVVVGGGTGGAPAAVAAARAGAKVIVVEWLNVLGGVATEGRIGGYYHGRRCGFTAEVDAGMKNVAENYTVAKGEWYRRELDRLGAEVWFGTVGYGVVMKEDRLAAVKVALSDGSCAEIACKVAIDATGNCDLAAAAGCETEYLSAKELSLQGAGVAPQPLGLRGLNSDIGFVDETSAEDVFGFLLRARLSLPDRTWNVSQMVDSRERRRLVGAFRLTPFDILAGRRYADTICETESNFDTHGQTESDIFFVKSPGKRGDVHRAHVPYRCLLPKRVEGLLVTGLGLSAHRDAMPVLRMQPDVQNCGYAAGLAAAQAVKRGVAPRAIDVKELQRALVKKGCIGRSVLADVDSPAPDQTVFRIEACRALHERLKGMTWDEGWNFKGMSQFGRSVSDVDSALIALGACRYGFAAPEVVRLADQLTAGAAYSHFRAIARAAEGCGVVARDRRRLADALGRLLKLPGVGGHARTQVEPLPGYVDAEADRERNLVLRELVLARALYNLGDAEGLGLRTLRAYERDYRRAYANHARMVLAPEARPSGFRAVSDSQERPPVRGGFASPPVGWMTWYAVRFAAGDDVVLRNARAFKAAFGDCLAERPVLWVDWEWCHAGFLCGSAEGEDSLTPRRSLYPRGMAPLAADLKDLGFVPALWVSAVSDVKTNAMFAARPDWMLPFAMRWCGAVWGDPTAPGFCEEYVPYVFRTGLSWGYEAFKWDTLPHAMLVFDAERGAMKAPDGSAAEILRRMVAAGRRAVGPHTYLLSCSGETDAAVEAAPDLFDAARVGADVWKWEDFVREGVDRFLKYAPLHGKDLWCDMDNLVLRKPFSNLAQARTRVTLTSLFGVPITLGDEIAALDGARIDMLRKALPTINVRPVGSARRNPDGVFEAAVDFRRAWGEWQVKSFSNFDTNRTQFTVFDAGDCVVWDFWRNELVSGTGGWIVLEVPPGDTRLLRLTPRESDRPMLIGTSRHISQGGVEIDDFSVSADGTVRIVPSTVSRRPFEAVLMMPDGRLERRRVASAPSAGHGNPTPDDLCRMVQDPNAFAVGKLPARAVSWPSRRMEIGRDDWLFDVDDWRVDLCRGWRWVWRPAADFPPELEGFERPAYDDSSWGAVDLPATWEALGHGIPLYINSGWPFPKDPPRVPLAASSGDDRKRTITAEPNPTARLRRRFDLPASWKGRETRLWIGAAQAAVAVWCNGAFVGFSQGGADAAEFDLTPHVKPGGNLLALQTFKYAAGSYLEDQDAWRVSGLYREVFLYSVAASHIEDVAIAPDLAGRAFTAEVRVANPPAGGTVEFRVGDSSATDGASSQMRLRVASQDFPKWNPESPSLAPARVVLRDANGGVLDIRHFRTALRSSVVEDGVYRFNGRPFKFQGVNRHEIDPLRFRAVTREGMLRDAALMKAANFNSVRTSHYTQHPLWYEICDRVGLAVVAEANLESHGLSYHACVLPGDRPEWEKPALDRLERMVRALRNHPGVALWSLGNEAGYGGVFEKGAALVRTLDPMRRPIQYADMNAVADFDSQTYPTVAWLKDWLAGKAERKGEHGEAAAMRQHGPQPSGKPYLANEYAHAMGNSTGNFAEYWEMFDSSPRFAGGFVWEWCEHGIASHDALGHPRVPALPGARTWLYGGDFGDRPNGGNFCCDGLVRADRMPNPGLAEVRHVQQPLGMTCDGTGGKAKVRLRNRFFFTSLDPARDVLNWSLLSDGELVRSGVWRLERPVGPRDSWDVPVPGADDVDGEKVLRVRLVRDGGTVAECEALLGGSPREEVPVAGRHPLFSAAWQAVFDRVPTDNDRGCRFTAPAAASGTVGRTKTGTALTLRFEAKGDHAREGIRCFLPTAAVARVAWYGRGPGENMPDRCHGSLLGVWRTDDPASLCTAYTRPQENGERWEVRWVELTAADGAVVRIRGERPFGFCLRPYGSDELAAARHATDLPPLAGPPRCWELTLDAAMRGAGGDNSWSERPMACYRLSARRGRFCWRLSGR